jgi:transposase
MSARHYQAVLNRQQEMLLPPCVEDYIGQDNPVMAIDIYIETLNMQELDFKNTQPVLLQDSHPYDPAALLKRYLYGYLQGIRKLERETLR